MEEQKTTKKPAQKQKTPEEKEILSKADKAEKELGKLQKSLGEDFGKWRPMTAPETAVCLPEEIEEAAIEETETPPEPKAKTPGKKQPQPLGDESYLKARVPEEDMGKPIQDLPVELGEIEETIEAPVSPEEGFLEELLERLKPIEEKPETRREHFDFEKLKKTPPAPAQIIEPEKLSPEEEERLEIPGMFHEQNIEKPAPIDFPTEKAEKPSPIDFPPEKIEEPRAEDFPQMEQAEPEKIAEAEELLSKLEEAELPAETREQKIEEKATEDVLEALEELAVEEQQEALKKELREELKEPQKEKPKPEKAKKPKEKKNEQLAQEIAREFEKKISDMKDLISGLERLETSGSQITEKILSLKEKVAEYKLGEKEAAILEQIKKLETELEKYKKKSEEIGKNIETMRSKHPVAVANAVKRENEAMKKKMTTQQQELENIKSELRLYDLLVTRYSDVIQTKTEEAELKELVTPDDKTIKEVAKIIKEGFSEEYKYRKNYLDAAKKAFYFTRDDIKTIKTRLEPLFHLSPEEIIETKAAAPFDKCLFLCSLLRSLEGDAKVVVGVLENKKNYPIVLTFHEETSYLLDPNQTDFVFEEYRGPVEETLPGFKVKGTRFEEILDTFDDKEHITG